MARFDVVEIFSSINGEGMKAGELAVFIRMKGCNLSCSYCDTRWACEPQAFAIQMTETEIINEVKKTGINNVTLTGGEPLLQPDIMTLFQEFAKYPQLQIEIETNGSIDVQPFRMRFPQMTFTIDYKMPASGMDQAMCLSNFEQITSDDCVKLVVSDRADLEFAKAIIDTYQLDKRCHTILSPVFDRLKLSDIVDFMKENTMNHVKMQLQMHKYVWDPNTKGV